MHHPEYLYYLLMFGVAAPAALRGRRVAAAIFGVWCLAKAGYEIGLPEAETLVLLYSAAFASLAVDVWVSLWRYRWQDMIAWLWFIPLQIVANRMLGRTIDPWFAWWMLYISLMLQMAFVIDRQCLALPLRILRIVNQLVAQRRGMRRATA